MSCNSCYWNGMEDEKVQSEVKKFAKQGAIAALEEIGFYDKQGVLDRDAVDDFKEARSMLKDWREFKASTTKAVMRWVLYIALGMLAVQMGLGDYLKMGKQ